MHDSQSEAANAKSVILYYMYIRASWPGQTKVQGCYNYDDDEEDSQESLSLFSGLTILNSIKYSG